MNAPLNRLLARCAVAAALASPLASAAGKTSGGSTSWSGAVAISPVDNPDPTRDSQLNDVAVNANGLAVAAWDQYWYTGNGGSSIGIAVQPPGGKWGAPLTVSDTLGFALHPRVAAGADGTLAVAWTYQTPALNPPAHARIQVAVRPAGSTGWSVATLAEGPLGGVAVTSFVSVGIDAAGSVTAGWVLWDGAHSVVQAATLPKGGSWSAPVTVAPGVDGLYPSLAVNARGDAGFVWSVSAYAGVNMPYAAQYSFRSGPGGSWSAPVAASETIPSSVGYVSSPIVALDANGLATVAYMGYGLEVNRQLTSESWTGPAAVIPPPNAVSSYTSFDLAVDDGGNAVVVASIFDATINVDRASIWVARGTTAGSWNAPLRLTDPTVPVDAYAARAAVSPDGSLAMVGWIDHYHGTVQVSRLGNGVWGSPSSVGRGTAFSSFQEVLGLHAGSGTSARAVWKNAKTGTQTMAASYGR